MLRQAFVSLFLIVFASIVVSAPEWILYGEPNAEIIRDNPSHAPRPPILLIPGLVSSRLVAWKHKPCRGPDINIQDVIWLNLQKMIETMTYDQSCWINCLKLNKNGTDPIDCKVRADEGLSAVGELSPGNIYTPPATSIFTALIKMLAHDLGYDVNNIIGAPYDWRLSPIHLEDRDSFFTTLKFRIETAVRKHRRPSIVIAHSMGNNLFLYFCDWLKYINKPSIGWEKWLRKHIWGYIGYAAPLLGAPGALKAVISGHTFGLTISEAQARELEITYDSTHFLNPRSSVVGKKNIANKNFPYDYNEPIVTIKSSTGASQIAFGIDDIANGEIFKWLGNMYNDDKMFEKYESLQSQYINDPLQPLGKLYRRPPIKHVMMVYGVDLQTEVGYSYRMPEVMDDKKNVNIPILDEIYYERPPKKTKENNATNNTNETVETRDVTAIFDHVDVDNFGNVTSVNVSSEYSNSSINIVENDDVIESITATIELEIENKKNKNKNAPQRDIKSEIYAATQRQKGGKGNKTRFVRYSEQHHTGDVTVPYLSLSYAHAWLDEGEDIVKWEEYRPEVVHKSTWNPLRLGGNNGGSIDPSVEIFYSKSNKNGDTTIVIEVNGVDHLEISKHPYVNSVVFEHLLPKMTHEMALNDTSNSNLIHVDGACYESYDDYCYDHDNNDLVTPSSEVTTDYSHYTLKHMQYKTKKMLLKFMNKVSKIFATSKKYIHESFHKVLQSYISIYD